MASIPFEPCVLLAEVIDKSISLNYQGWQEERESKFGVGLQWTGRCCLQCNVDIILTPLSSSLLQAQEALDLSVIPSKILSEDHWSKICRRGALEGGGGGNCRQVNRI